LLPGGERAFSWNPAAAASLEPGATLPATLPATGELIDLMVNAFYVPEGADHKADHRV